ncbi:uncharacterized protein LOC118599127 [Oryzias melastigma]|uniref:uncharacterized protein LOC118599127 n=1 Tax=Oryzias melastigma TaxID=30732 RepID=UPI00168D111B|nr:uncharacterized protein LOC118599127 [Oryzias melastigma]
MGVVFLSSAVVPVSADGASGRGGRKRDGGAPCVGDHVHADTLPVLGTPAKEREERPEREKPTFSLPRYDPCSPGSGGPRDEARLKVRLARLQFEAQEKAHTRQMQLEIKRMEIEAETAVKIRQLELEAKAHLPVSSVDSANPLFPGSPAGLLDGVGTIHPPPVKCEETPDSCFEPFVMEGSVSLNGESVDEWPVRMLRDTGGSQTVILVNTLDFSDHSYCGYDSILCGIGMEYSPRPVHRVHLKSELISGVFPMAVCPALPIKGVAILLGNDVAGGKVVPHLEVLQKPISHVHGCASQNPSERKLYPACAITRSQSRKNADLDLSDCILMSAFAGDEQSQNASAYAVCLPPAQVKTMVAHPSKVEPALPITRTRQCAEQRADPT